MQAAIRPNEIGKWAFLPLTGGFREDIGLINNILIFAFSE